MTASEIQAHRRLWGFALWSRPHFEMVFTAATLVLLIASVFSERFGDARWNLLLNVAAGRLLPENPSCRLFADEAGTQPQPD